MSNRNQRMIIGAVLVAIVILAMGVFLSILMLQPEVTPPLDPVSPSENPPENTTDVETIQIGPLIMNVTANATGMIPHNGPITFHLSVFLTITNTGLEFITDFNISKMSVYNLASELFYTFSFQQSYANATIPAGSTITLIYSNQEQHIDVPFEPWDIYARALVTFDVNREAILTTPLITGIFAIE